MTDDVGAELARYEWIESSRDPRLEALSVTVTDTSGDRCLEILRPRSEMPIGLTIAEALEASLGIDDYAWGSVCVQLDRIGDRTVLIEPNGWVTSFDSVLAALSGSGRAVNVFWNVNAVMSFGLADGGAMVRQFDPLLYDAGARPLSEEIGLPFGHPGRPHAAVLALLTRLSGVVIERSWLLDRPRRTFVVPLSIADE